MLLGGGGSVADLARKHMDNRTKIALVRERTKELSAESELMRQKNEALALLKDKSVADAIINMDDRELVAKFDELITDLDQQINKDNT